MHFFDAEHDGAHQQHATELISKFSDFGSINLSALVVMAMTLLPSFQTFLQNSATPHPSTLLSQRPQSPSHLTNGWRIASNVSGVGMPYYSSNSYSNSYSRALSLRRTKNENISSSGSKRPYSSVNITNPGPLLPRTGCSATGKRVKKKYLKECERYEIVRRVRSGEKQAHLAKEFGVSRAAVCYLLKHQIEIMRRSSQCI